MDRNTKDILEAVVFIRDNMYTKSEGADLKKDVQAVRAELKDIRSELEDVGEKVENISGYRKEIDHALERIKVIERHLKIYP